MTEDLGSTNTSLLQLEPFVNAFSTLLPRFCRSEHGQMDQFFSSGSDGGSDGQVPDGERALSKAKIYPMGRGMLYDGFDRFWSLLLSYK